MAQVTAPISRAEFEIQVSTDGSSWNNIDTGATTVASSGGDQLTGSQNTADGEAPVVTGANKTGAITVTVNSVWTKTSNDPWDRVRDRWEGTDKTIYLRWAPAGGIGTVVGNDIYTCMDDAGSAFKCPIINCLPPDLDAGSGDPAMFAFSVIAPDVVRGTTTT